MIITLIAAMAENRVIGRDNRMPWKLPLDRKRFHGITRGHPVIMGRKTYESIGRALADRKNIVLSRQPGYEAAGCIVVHDLDAAFAAAQGAEEVFVLGGAQVFREAIGKAHKIYLTLVRIRSEGDAFFPELPEDFIEEERVAAEDALPVLFIRYARKGQTMQDER